MPVLQITLDAVAHVPEGHVCTLIKVAFPTVVVFLVTDTWEDVANMLALCAFQIAGHVTCQQVFGQCNNSMVSLMHACTKNNSTI